jgi:phospholipid/cholesterol/gamma-HCH transport system substrate-binding protein
MRRLATALIAVGACATAVVLAGAGGSNTDEREYRIVFDNAFGLTEGGDFRVGGVTAGKITAFDVTRAESGAPKAVVTATVTQPGFGDFRRDATCTIRPQSLIGEYYVDCRAGAAERKLEDGGTVPVEQTESTIPLDLVNNILRRPYRERLRLIVTELGTGLAGRPEDLADVLRRAHPGLRETSKVLRILGDQNDVIERFIADSDTVIRELERNKGDVARWVVEAGRAAEAAAARRRELAQTFHRLPGFVDELRPTMARLGELANQQAPLLAELQRAAPDLNAFFARLGPFADSTRPALRSLGAASKSGSEAFAEGAQEVAALRRLARDAPPAAKPLRQFLQTIDDRRRAVEPDRRAARGAPPPPDKTATEDSSSGFTGMEAVWNYFFWQTLTLNAADDVGHVLKLVGIVNDCREYRTSREPDDHAFDRCRQWLGPYQPGITAPDPTEDGASAAGPREPEAQPLPGRRDLSRPHVVAGPDVRRLLGELRSDEPKPAAPQAPRTPPPGAGVRQRLLDFLLAP